MSDEEKSLDSFTHSVMLDCDAKFTTIIDEKKQSIEFIYVDNIHIRQYVSVYNFTDLAFCNVLPQFLRYIFEELLTNKSYKISEVNDAFVSIIFQYKVMKKDAPIHIRLNVKDFTGTAEGSLSEIEYLKAQVSQMRTEMNIMKNVLTRNVNKVRITLSDIFDTYFPCEDQNNKSIIKIPDTFINNVNCFVISDFAKISAVRIKKIQNLMKIDVDLELYSKECYYFLTQQVKTEFQTKKLENFTTTLTESSGPVFFGSSTMTNPFGTSDAKGKINGVYLILYDRRQKWVDKNNMYTNSTITKSQYGVLFPPNEFPLNNVFVNDNRCLYAILQDKKELEADSNVTNRNLYLNNRAIIEKLLEP